MSDFRIPTSVSIAPGCSARLPRVLQELDVSRVLFVTDPGLAGSAIVTAATAGLTAAGLQWQLFGETPRNPRTTTAEQLASLAQGCEAVVAFGGGSVMDAGKAAAMLATNGGKARDWLGKQVFPKPPLPFIAVPTTCGTGSEVTWVSVLTDEERETKISIKGAAMFPSVALVDSHLIRGLPAELIATTGMDAMTHALEATTGSVRNPVSDAMAEKSIALSLKFLARAVQRGPEDDEALEAIMRASTLAGLAFGNSDVAGVHCLSETLGGLYDVPHGLANALLLLPVLRSHGKHVEQRLAELDQLTRDDRGPGRASDFLQRLETLVAALELPPVSELGIEAEQHGRIAALSVANGSNSSNPRVMNAEDYLSILASL